jgi:hypothetical protein
LKALSLFLEGYTRKSIDDACAATQGGVDVENLTVWANRTGKWEKLVVPSSLDVEKQTRWSNRASKWGKVDAVPKEWNPEGSLCREVVTKVFGLSSEQYEAMRDVFDDVNSPDPMGIYQLNQDPSKYAIVLRLPQRDKYAALKIGGTAGAGVIVGVLGKMAHERWKDEREKWFEAYKKFLLHSERLHITSQDLEKRQNIQERERPVDVKPLPDKIKNNIFEWQYCELFPKEECHEKLALRSWGPSLEQKYFSGELLSKKTRLDSADYYSKLFAQSDDHAVVQKQVELLQDAKVVDEQFNIMQRNKEWYSKIDFSKPITWIPNTTTK